MTTLPPTPLPGQVVDDLPAVESEPRPGREAPEVVAQIADGFRTEHQRPHARSDAVRADHDVERSRRAVVEGRADPIGFLGQRGDFGAVADLDEVAAEDFEIRYHSAGISEAWARQDTGLTNDEWLDGHEAEFRRIGETGRYPALDRLTSQQAQHSLDQIFEYGLRLLLDGLEQRLQSP
ncbi:TetR/AcrR family transcriptional regulator C-terminal domain-containing protein [Amycolatopsis circi]|uniref:TetR/AcrR family transcriptional regulator C-terminal domain-containing protein n=1 Tax=Amycolatopsis circi TaxID=871959 RepID=UPI000E255E8D|nr:TetR/AcrR family transcriptional regulator C-terminal domain-containing protein [Amycolatopsis circi]